MYQKLKNKQNILFCLILLTFVNSISTSSVSDSDEHSLSSSSSSSSSSHSKHSSTNLYKEDADEVLPKQLFAQYRESYITKDDAKKFRQRIHAHKKPYSDRDYDDFIQEMEFKPKKSKKVAADIYDKKYFDYLPAEDDSDNENAGRDKKSAPPKKHSKHHHHHKSSKGRSRRDTLAVGGSEFDANKDVTKRETHASGYYYPVPANPWTDNYYQSHRPYVNRQYLPVPIYIVPQLQPFGVYPSSPSHNNIGHPPVNPPINTQIVTESPMGLVNRFDDEEDRPVWEMWDINAPNSIQIVNPTRPQPTRRPPPSILRTTTTQQPPRNMQRRPAPPIIRNPIKSIPDETKMTAGTLNSVQSTSDSNRAPELGPPFQSDNRPRPIQSDDNQPGTGPSRCVWGIVSCCKRGSLALRYNCFENLGCGGAFWDLNPCTEAILDMALKQTNEHFD